MPANSLDPRTEAQWGPEPRNRRKFLRFLAGSPLLSAIPAAAWQSQNPSVLADPKDALNVMDFEAAARQALPPAHFGYMATGVDDDATLRANREGFSRFQLRPRRLVDVTRTDLRVEVLGTVLEHPIVLAPAGNQKAFHPEGELATARAARSKRTQLILSTVTTCPVEEVAASAGRPIWYQLYPTSRWEVTEKLVRHAEAAGCPVLVLTVDNQAGRRTETQERFKRMDSRKCAACHEPQGFFRRKPMFDGIDMTGVTTNNPAMTWESVRRLKALTRMKLVIKGIETREDALLCGEHGVDGIIVSNHGGRAEESGRGTIECLPEVVDAVGGRIPVLVDGGFRRGTDIFKALALGARAVGIGRPYLWGLGAFGQPGVERVLELLRAELELVMKQCGTTSIAQIGRSSIAVAH
jgi:4-hydroxymandelate oxidase